MKKTSKIETFEYDLKRVDKVSLIIIWVIVALVILQAFLQDPKSGMDNALKAFPVGILATIVYFLPIKRFIKSLLFGLIPAVCVCAAMALDVFALDKHYMVFASTALIALYFDRKLLLAYGGVVNAVLLALYILVPKSLLGELDTWPVYLSIFLLFNSQVVILFFLTKWGSGILHSALKNNEDIRLLLGKLRESGDAERKQYEYQKAYVNKLLENLRRISQGDLDCDLSLEDCDENSRELYDLHASINDSLRISIGALRDMAGDVAALAQAVQNGELEKRADAARYAGEYRNIVSGMNDALGSIRRPIQSVSDLMGRISHGDLDGSIATDFRGDYKALVANVNATAAGLKEIVGDISSVLTQMAEGNMDVAVSAAYSGEFLKIKESLNHIIGSFNGILHGIGESSTKVALGTRQFSGGAQALAQGAEEQSSAVEQLTASIAEIAEQTRQNASNASEANDLALSVKTPPAQGDGLLQGMLASMVALHDSSENISNIVKTIDDIASQTSILALNAAVEAARAGNHGKGFAVVAEEVRSLAGKSAEAAKETAELIEGSIKGVEEGLRYAQDSTEAFREIMDGAEKTALLVSGIAQASGQQAMGISQVSRGIGQVAAVVQSNTATAEQSAATCEELAGQADRLEEMATRFRLRASRG